MTPSRWFFLILSLCVTFIAVLFTIQNSGRMTDLSLDLYFTAFHLEREVAIPYLLLGTLGSGLLVGTVVGRLGGGSSGNTRVDSYASSASSGSATIDDDWT